jgi:hypothetical protein
MQPLGAQLNALADRYYGSDPNRKPATYLTEYERLFGPMRHAPLRLLELGGKISASMLLWSDYFPNATIVGFDAGDRPKDFPTDKRIHFVQGSQDDRTALDKCAEAAGGQFDIIVDDASHIGRLSASSFSYLFPRLLKPGGFYVIEDICTAFLPEFPDSEPFDASEIGRQQGDRHFPSHQVGMVGVIKQLFDHVMAPVAQGHHSRYAIERMFILTNIAIVQKAAQFDRISSPSWTALEAVRALGAVDKMYEVEAKRYIDDFNLAQGKAQWRDISEPIGVYYHSRGNYYMYPIALGLQQALVSAGASCRLLTEQDDTSQIAIPIIVAPHEFFVLGIAPRFTEPAFLARSILYNTEQLDSPWFQTLLPFIKYAKAIIDINFHSSLVLQKWGIKSTHVLPPVDATLAERIKNDFEKAHPLLDVLRPEEKDKVGSSLPICERPLDVLFTGYRTPYRDRVFVRHANCLSKKRTMLIYPSQPPGPTPLGSAVSRRSVSFEMAAGLASLSKVVLNVHRTPIGYFEWQRMVVQGFSQRSAVVAGPTLRSPFFGAGRDYLECPTRNLDKMISWLIGSREGLGVAEDVATRGYRRVTSMLTAERIGRFLLSFVRAQTCKRRN